MEGTIQQLFEGHHMNYIECINVDYKSTRKESFYGTISKQGLSKGWYEFLEGGLTVLFPFRRFAARCKGLQRCIRII